MVKRLRGHSIDLMQITENSLESSNTERPKKSRLHTLLPKKKLTPSSSKAARKKTQDSGRKRALASAQQLDTLDLSAAPALHPKQRLIELRKECVSTANYLYSIAKGGKTDPVVKAAHLVKNCSLAGVFRSLPYESYHAEDVNFKIGQALCKRKVCPNCQRVLATKRKNNFLSFYDINSQLLGDYRFYHLVLTLRHSHSAKVRTALYTTELLQYFKTLRGSDNNRANAKWWNDRVAGGSYSVEPKSGRDGSPHIHMHVLLLAKRPLWNATKESKFLTHVKKRWKDITGDSDNIFIEPVYWLDGERGDKNRVKHYFDPKTGTSEQLRHAVSECIKYTIKSDADALAALGPDFVRDLITTKNRYYGRFGVLARVKNKPDTFQDMDRLCTDFKDLEQISQNEIKQLFNPTTGEVYAKEETKLALSYFRNTTPHIAPLANIHSERGKEPRGGEKYYSFNARKDVVFFNFDEQRTVAIRLANTLKKRYSKEKDLLYEDDQICVTVTENRRNAPISFEQGCAPCLLGYSQPFRYSGASNAALCSVLQIGYIRRSDFSKPEKIIKRLF